MCVLYTLVPLTFNLNSVVWLKFNDFTCRTLLKTNPDLTSGIKRQIDAKGISSNHPIIEVSMFNNLVGPGRMLEFDMAIERKKALHP